MYCTGSHQSAKWISAAWFWLQYRRPSTCLIWVSMPIGFMNSGNSSAPGVAVGVTS